MSALAGDNDEHLRALGSLVVQAGTLEHLVFDFVIMRSGISRLLGNVLMGRDNFDAMLSRLGRLIAAADDVEQVAKNQYKGWSNQAAAAMKRRNELIHSYWTVPAINDEALERFYFSRDAVDLPPKEMTAIREIEELASAFLALSNALFLMAEKLGVGTIT